MSVASTIAARLAALAALALTAACASDDGPPPDETGGKVGGQILMSLDGPLVGAQVSIDHLEYLADRIDVRTHLGDLTTDAAGHFEIPTGLSSGYFLIKTRGGQFRDFLSGQTIALDPADEFSALLYTDLGEKLTTGLVTPISHLALRLIETRTEANADGSLVDSYNLVTEHLDAHFGGVPWERVTPADLTRTAGSPTNEIRAAFVLAAWSLLSRNIATAAGSSVQEVNAYTLALDLGDDLAAPPFDGNDANDRTSGSGLQFGTCPPPSTTCQPTSACDLGQCRSKCDAYANTTRTALAAHITAAIGDTNLNRTGLTTADTLTFVRALAGNRDAILFGDACVDLADVDLDPPMLTWGATPADGAVVRGAVTWTVAADDLIDPAPVVTWGGGLPDSDTGPSSAATTIDTALGADGPRSVTAHAIDQSGNATDETRTIIADNLAPALTVDSAGFFPDGATWWSSTAAPVLTGTVADDHGPITIEARIGGAVVASTMVGSGSWQLTIPAGMIAPAGSTVVVHAIDAPGNVSAETPATSPFLRVDTTPPSVTAIPTTFYREASDAITFPSPSGGPHHSHNTGAAVMLGGTGACAVISKYAYLTATAPAGTEVVSGNPTPVRNQLTFQVRASDSGVGLDPATFRYTVTTPNGATFGPFPLTATPVVGSPGAYDATAILHRDGAEAIPAIGIPGSIQESTGPAGARTVYTVTLDARDRLGQLAAVAPCFDYAPLGPPLQVTQTAREAVPSATVRTLKGGTFDLPAGTTSQLLNDTAAAGVLEVWVRNRTPDPAYIDITAPAPAGATYTKRITTYLKPGSLVASSTPTCTIDAGGVNGHAAGGQPLCYGNDPTPLADVVVGTPTAITGWQSSIGVYEVTTTNVTSTAMSPCPGCSAAQYEIPAGAHRAIIVGARGISDLRPDVAGPYSEVDSDYTGAIAPGAATVQDCEVWSPVIVDVTERCTQRRNYTQYRSLKAAGVSIPENVISADWNVRAAPLLTTTSPPPPLVARRLAAVYLWTTTEN